MANQNICEKFGEWIRRKAKHHHKYPSRTDDGLVSYTGTSNAHRPLPMVEVTRSPDSADVMVYTIPHSGFDPSSGYLPDQTGMVVLREGEMMRGFKTLFHVSPQPVKNNPKVEKPSSLKKVNKERMQRKMDTDG